MMGRNTQPRPILVHFNWNFNKTQVLERSRMLYQSGVSVEEDWPIETSQKRATLNPIMRKAKRTSGFNNTKLVGDRLFVNGRPYTVDTVENLPEEINPTVEATKSDGNVTLFYTRYSKLSNHNAASFEVDDITYRSSEQYYFAERCRIMGDDYQRSKVLAAVDPKDCQRLGRQANNPNGVEWSNFERVVMKKACQEKFSKNAVAKQALLRTGSTRLGESSRSSHWGTGFYVNDPRAFETGAWQTNLLGDILTEVRSELQCLKKPNRRRTRRL
jgi:ribA/ribD-fused uncharacterized protein